MATIADLLVKIGVDADDLEQGMGSAASFVDDNFAKISAAGVVAGAALEGFARSQQPVTRDLRKLAASTGITEDAMRDLVKETSNVTFPLDEVISVMESGRQQGLKSADDLQRYAQFWDMVGDATGESASVLADSGVALRAVGIAAGDEGKALDAFGFISQETTQDIGEFLTFLERTGPELNEMGAGVDEAAAILGVMEDQFGMTGRVARTEFRKAVNGADGDMGKMLDTLGISTSQFDEYMGKVSESSGVIQRNADIHADSFTPMQKLSHAAQELMLEHGGLAEAAGMLALPMLALGPIMKGITSLGGPLVKAFGAVGKGFLVLSKILLANPWVLVAVAIIALVVVVVKNWDKIVKVIGKAWDWITAKFRQATAWLKRTWESMWGAVTRAADRAVASVTRVIGRAWDWIVGKFRQATNWLTGVWGRTWSAVTRTADRAVAFVRGIPGKILSALSGLASSVASFIAKYHPAAVLYRMLQAGIPRVLSFVRAIPGRILRGLGNMGNLLKGAGRALLRGLTDGIKSMASAPVDAVKGIAGRIKNLLPGSPVKDGPLRVLNRGYAGAQIVGMIAGGMGASVGALARQAEEVARAALPAFGVPSLPGASVRGGGGAWMLGDFGPRGGAGFRDAGQTIVIELDGREIGRGVAPHIAREVKVHTGVRA